MDSSALGPTRPAGHAGRSGEAPRLAKPELPAAARDLFRHAEALCEQQQFAEAVPIFEQVLRLLQECGSTLPAMSVVAADVWAHLGVAMQSLDRVPEAMESYRRAVALDPTLHVCFANLASLYAYTRDRERALENIERALALDPANPAYAGIRQQLSAAKAEEEAGKSSPELPSSGAGRNYYAQPK